MGDYLDTVVSECKTNSDNTRATLNVDGLEPTEFVLPLPLHLSEGDRIEFYMGNYANPLSHRDYRRATVYRGDKEIISLNSRDMRILTELREAEHFGIPPVKEEPSLAHKVISYLKRVI